MAPPTRIDSAAERSLLVREALSVASREHAGQTRETGNGKMPFLDHLLDVAERLDADDQPDWVLAVALLHDTLERTDTEPAELRRRFGEQVAAAVEAMTEDEAIDDYEERKTEHRARLAAASPEARAVFAADKTANIALLRGAYGEVGEDVGQRLSVTLDRKVGVWERDLEMLSEASPGAPAIARLSDELGGLRRQRAGQSARLA